MNPVPQVAVVILNWNGRKHLSQFLSSVLASTWPNLQVVVGDNGSTDGSLEFLRQNFPTVKIIENESNFGFTGGYNRVLAKVDSEYFILLNSDVEVPAGWIEPVVGLMESDPLIAAAAPKIKSFSQKNCFEHAGAAGGFLDWYGYPFCRGRMFYEVEADSGQYDTSGEVFWASGAALFIRRQYWLAAGGFDDRFFAHMEEIDLCWRLKNLGYRIMYCGRSEVYHVGGGTLNTENPFKTFLNFRNNLLLLQNNLSPWRAALVIFIRFWMDFLAMARFLREGKRRDAWAVSRAHQNFVRQLFSERPRHSGKRSNLLALKGLYKRSLVWDFFIRKKTKFSDLDPKNFY